MEKGMKNILEEIENKIIPWFKRCEDLDLFMRMYALGYKGYNIQEKLYEY